MPEYTTKITCPTSATFKDRTEKKIKVSQGQIAQVTVTWTPGSQWLNGLVVKYEGGQIIPSEGSEPIRGDGYPDTWPEHIILDKPQPELVIEVWNEGNDYEHDALVSIVVLPILRVAWKPVRDFVDMFRRLTGV